jgi:hypothetical protein
VLAIPITTVASESAFSTGDRVLDPFRSSLAPRTVEALVCSQNWLRSKPLNYDSKMDDDEESYKLDVGKLSNLYHNNALIFYFFLLLISFVGLYCDCNYFSVAFFVEINLKNSSNNSGLEDDYID